MKKLTGLEHFQAVCSTRNLTTAAQLLGMSQPALSQAITKLERQLDAELIDRSTRPISITPYGHMVLDYAREMQDATDDLLAKIEAVRTGTGGVLRVGCGPDWIHDVVPGAIALMHGRNPQLPIKLTVALNDDLRLRLDAGELDLFFASVSDVFFGAAYRTRILVRDRMYVVANRNHPIHAWGRVTPEHLARESWVMTGDETFGRQLVRRVFTEAGVDFPLPSIETNSVRAMINILLRTPKLGFISEAHARAYPDIAKVETTTEMPMREGGAVWRSDVALIPAAAHFIALAEEVIAAQTGQGAA